MKIQFVWTVLFSILKKCMYLEKYLQEMLLCELSLNSTDLTNIPIIMMQSKVGIMPRSITSDRKWSILTM